MTRSVWSCTALITVLLVPAANACERPDKVTIPTGDRVSESELIATDTSVREYMAAMYEYLDCVAAETAAAQRTMSTRDIESMRQLENDGIDLHNDATQEMKQALADFDKVIQEYRARQGS